ncbi:MAG: hypothetical protein NVSMB51_06030 [Solirubrobacteraceae bacterium]
MSDYVFGYGSLLSEFDARPARLLGYRRCWGVAMDNRIDIPGYKFFLAPGGLRPAVDVAFLDIAPAPGESVAGSVQAVSGAELSLLDARERNYQRTDVSELVPALNGRVWAYVGRDDARARFERARTRGSLVVARDYAARAQADTAGLPCLELRPVSLSEGQLPPPAR